MGVGTFNLFPLKPLDGGLIFEEILKHFYNGKYVKYLVNGVSLLVLALLLFNLFGPNLLSLIKQII
jgi:Zn-dependent protease